MCHHAAKDSEDSGESTGELRAVTAPLRAVPGNNRRIGAHRGPQSPGMERCLGAGDEGTVGKQQGPGRGGCGL